MHGYAPNGQAALRQTELFPTPLRVQLRVPSVSESGKRKSSVEGAQYSFSRVGRLMFRSAEERVRQSHPLDGGERVADSCLFQND